MKTRRSIGNGLRLATGLLSLTLALTLLPHQSLAEGFQLTDQQNGHMKQRVLNAQSAMVVGQHPQQDIDAASNAIKASMTTSYSNGAGDAVADMTAGRFLAPYVPAPGPKAAAISALMDKEKIDASDRLAVTVVKNRAEPIVKDRLPEPYAVGVLQSTERALEMDAKLQKVLNEWPTEQKEREVILDAMKDAMIEPFKNLPPMTDPASPFHNGIPGIAKPVGPQAPSGGSPYDETVGQRDNGNGTTTFVIKDQDGNVREETQGTPQPSGNTLVPQGDTPVEQGGGPDNGNTKKRDGGESDTKPSTSSGGSSAPHHP